MKKSRLVDVSEAKKKLRSVRDYFGGPPQTEQDKLAQAVVKMCIEEVDKLKPVDAVEVVHGRWEYHDCVCSGDGLIAVYACSECGRCINEDIFDCLNRTNYCPNCGAKMDGERRNEYA